MKSKHYHVFVSLDRKAIAHGRLTDLNDLPEFLDREADNHGADRMDLKIRIGLTPGDEMPPE